MKKKKNLYLRIDLNKGQGDDTRTWGPPYVEDQSVYFLSINRNKQSIAVDMSHKQGQTIIREVILNNLKIDSVIVIVLACKKK